MNAIERLHHRESLLIISAEARRAAREGDVSVFYINDARCNAGVVELRPDGQKLRHMKSPVDGGKNGERHA
ncbi:hypothetical protein QO002_002740 [Pararhizobium capsulatum DSM 1112]|uniref:Uncharacterized protein n=2 Tax=Pararhizobium capsulatum TaxID=34014 RepID=A0ABU0BUT7_9HYPH|nr:hypothetical protein [Pararhizobium capsulatum DSM 1112]